MACCQSCADEVPAGTKRYPIEQGHGFAGTQLSEVMTQGEDLFVWGPASVEAVSEDAKLVRMSAIEAALPAAFKRGAVSVFHKDQVVGKFPPLTPVELGRVPGQLHGLAKHLAANHGGWPTGVIMVTDEIVQSFPHLRAYQGTRQFFVGGVIYGDTETARTIQSEIRQGHLNSYSISGMALESNELRICDAPEQCKTVQEILQLDLSAVTLGSRQGGEGPFSSRVRNPGAQFLLVQQGGGVLSQTVPSKTPNSSVGTDTMPDAVPDAVPKPDATIEQASPVEQADENAPSMEQVVAALGELMRRMEALEQKVAVDEDVAAVDEAEDEPVKVEEAKPTEVAQAVTLKDVEAHAEKHARKVFDSLIAQARTAETPVPASPRDASKSKGAELMEAAMSGDLSQFLLTLEQSKEVKA